MAGEHIKPMKDAIAEMKQARRDAIKVLIDGNNTHNRTQFLQIHATMTALKEVQMEEKSID